MDFLRKLICAVAGHDWRSLGIYHDDIEFAGRPRATTASDNAVYETVQCRCCAKVDSVFVTWGSTDDPGMINYLESRGRVGE